MMTSIWNRTWNTTCKQSPSRKWILISGFFFRTNFLCWKNVSYQHSILNRYWEINVCSAIMELIIPWHQKYWRTKKHIDKENDFGIALGTLNCRTEISHSTILLSKYYHSSGLFLVMQDHRKKTTKILKYI